MQGQQRLDVGLVELYHPFAILHYQHFLHSNPNNKQQCTQPLTYLSFKTEIVAFKRYIFITLYQFRQIFLMFLFFDCTILKKGKFSMTEPFLGVFYGRNFCRQISFSNQFFQVILYYFFNLLLIGMHKSFEAFRVSNSVLKNVYKSMKNQIKANQFTHHASCQQKQNLVTHIDQLVHYSREYTDNNTQLPSALRSTTSEPNSQGFFQCNNFAMPYTVTNSNLKPKITNISNTMESMTNLSGTGASKAARKGRQSLGSSRMVRLSINEDSTSKMKKTHQELTIIAAFEHALRETYLRKRIRENSIENSFAHFNANSEIKSKLPINPAFTTDYCGEIIEFNIKSRKNKKRKSVQLRSSNQPFLKHRIREDKDEKNRIRVKKVDQFEQDSIKVNVISDNGEKMLRAPQSPQQSAKASLGSIQQLKLTKGVKISCLGSKNMRTSILAQPGQRNKSKIQGGNIQK